MYVYVIQSLKGLRKYVMELVDRKIDAMAYGHGQWQQYHDKSGGSLVQEFIRDQPFSICLLSTCMLRASLHRTISYANSHMTEPMYVNQWALNAPLNGHLIVAVT